jgi:non-ribosomal peptide synthetase component F
VINLDHPDVYDTDHGIVDNKSTLDQCAVILYTSGSTGVPKGVLLSHRNLQSHIMANTALFGIGRDDVIMQQTSPGFDFCLDQIFHALANGGLLVVVGSERRADPASIANLMLEMGVTVTAGCPSEYLALLNYGFTSLRLCHRWRLAFAGGEKLTFQLRKAFQKLRLDNLRFVNVYGPTEVTIACARGLVPYHTDEDLVGRGDYLFPMPGYEILVVDEDMNLVPAGFPGEVCITGDGVALGYLNRPQETRLRFIKVMVDRDTATPGLSLIPAKGVNNSATCNENVSALNRKIRLYRSGDYRRLLGDGSINLLGRFEGSGQVKIHGMRVELDEIANVMIRESEGALTSAAVSFRTSPVDLLVAFIVFDAEFGPQERRIDIVQRLKTTLPLPAHMRPMIVTAVDTLPTNVNGKLDRAGVDRLHISTADGCVSVDGDDDSDGRK